MGFPEIRGVMEFHDTFITSGNFFPEKRIILQEKKRK